MNFLYITFQRWQRIHQFLVNCRIVVVDGVDVASASNIAPLYRTIELVAVFDSAMEIVRLVWNAAVCR